MRQLLQATLWLAIGANLLIASSISRRAAATTKAANMDWPQISLAEVVGGLSQPVHITQAGDGSGRLFVVEQEGVLRIIRDGSVLDTPFLDIADRVRCCGEEGLLSVAFPPGYASRNHFYVYYVNNSGDLVIARYQTSANADVADRDSEQILLLVAHPTNTNHNGGQLAFGPDGYLYLGLGDGGSGGDPPNNAQNPGVLLGKMLRIDVETGHPLTYTIPASNPYTQTLGYRGEIWAVGLRNPWRFSFDRQTNDLLIGDVGQNAWEEIDFQPASSLGGENYGWRCYEGSHPYNTSNCGLASAYLFPVHEYSLSGDANPNCAVVGGFVYRGGLYVRMRGIYLYGDYCSGKIWGLRYDGAAWQNTELLDTALGFSSFGEDQAGSLYVTDRWGGGVYLIVDAVQLDQLIYLPVVLR
ncbi:MAG TPA: PQQ-dependent sugar dehydrogenase [Anaerolineales bacterium]|nr:PQQ-dependent sugar dehydrogenase [Anaerolineales bacterium]